MPFQETTSTFQRTYGSSARVFVATNAVRWNEVENMEKLDYKNFFFLIFFLLRYLWAMDEFLSPVRQEFLSPVPLDDFKPRPRFFRSTFRRNSHSTEKNVFSKVKEKVKDKEWNSFQLVCGNSLIQKPSVEKNSYRSFLS